MKTQLLEKSRADLLRQSKVADVTKSYGTTRYERRNKQHVYNLVANFNRIDFNALFKANLLSFIIPIHGETDDYNITVLFEGICDDIQKEIKANQYKLEYKCVYRALIKAINNQDIYISCDCPDWKYRMQYWSTKDRYNAGQSQIVPARVTNPENSKGAGCKHVLKVLSNLDWALKLSSTIYNYIIYMDQHMNDKFVKIIFPAIYGMSYDAAEKKGLFDQEVEDQDDELVNTVDNEDDLEVVDASNKRRGRLPKNLTRPNVEEVEEQEEEDGN